MTIHLQGEVEGMIRILDCPPQVAARIDRATSFPHPDYVRARRLGREGWGLPERLHTMREGPDGSIYVPRGCIDQLREVFRKQDCTIAWSNRRSAGDALGCFTKRIDLRDYQIYGVKQLALHMQGVISLPCGTGKTRLGVASIVELNRCALVLTHTADLADQWSKDLFALAGIVAGRLDADHHDIAPPVVVASVFSLLKLLATPEGERWVRRFGLVIVDEAHHAPAETFQDVLALIPAAYRLGLTATPQRDDGLSDLIFWSLGPMLLEKTTEEMIARGYLMMPEIVRVETEFRFAYDGPDKKKMGALDAAIMADPLRNAAIADIAARDALAGEWVFVLVQRRGHAFQLARMVFERQVPAIALTGGAGKKAKAVRARFLEEMREGRSERVFVGTSLLDEGVNIPRLSRVILAYPSSAENPVTQRVGRAIRDFPGKKPKIYDIVDPHVDTLDRRADGRARLFKKLGIAA